MAQDAVTTEASGGDAQWGTRDGRKVFCVLPEGLPEICLLPKPRAWCAVSLAAWCNTQAPENLDLECVLNLERVSHPSAGH